MASSESFNREINNSLDLVEARIKELRELNRPILDALDKQEIELRLNELEARDKTDKQALESKLTLLQDRVTFLEKKLYQALLWFLGIAGILAFALGLV
jgi:hypothetical protein